MVLEKLENTIKLFYPTGISSLKDYDKYVISSENKRLNNIKSNAFESQKIIGQIDNIILKAKEYETFKGIENHTSESFDRCFSLKVDYRKEKYLYQLYIRISILAPLYTIYVTSNPIENNPYRWLDTPKRDKDYENTILEEMQILKKIIESKTDYSFIDENTLNKVLENISYEDIDFGSFTMFNALFTNDI